VRFTAASDTLAPVLGTLAELNVQGLVVAPPSLEELFLRHYGDEAAVDTLEAMASGPSSCC
jgi:ABC-2 type transport system ATP-binding protein